MQREFAALMAVRNRSIEMPLRFYLTANFQDSIARAERCAFPKSAAKLSTSSRHGVGGYVELRGKPAKFRLDVRALALRMSRHMAKLIVEIRSSSRATGPQSCCACDSLFRSKLRSTMRRSVGRASVSATTRSCASAARRDGQRRPPSG